MVELKAFCQSSSVSSSNVLGGGPPLLFTKISIEPKALCAASKKLFICLEEFRSALRAITFTLLSAAVTKGITENMQPPEATNKSLYDITEEEGKKIKTLPRNLLEAIDSFKADPLTKEVFSEAMLNNFIGYKYDEWSRYHTTTTDWEIKEYLKLF